LKEGDGFIVSLAEHNGAYTSAFKSLFDWVSRVNVKMFQEKPMLLMSTAPGPRGGQSVFEIAENRFPRHNANLVSKFVLPTFNDNFKDGQIVNQDLDLLLNKAVTTLVDNIK